MGEMLGNNTHITELDILAGNGEFISTRDERALYAGLERNRSIRYLHFTGPLPAMFTAFVNPSNEFWEENYNLVSISLNGIDNLGRQEMSQLCSVIVATKNLAHLEITHSIEWDEQYLFSMLLNTLRGKSSDPMNDQSLKSLWLQGNIIGAASMKNIVRTIQSCCPDLEELNLQSIPSIGHHSYKIVASLLREI